MLRSASLAHSEALAASHATQQVSVGLCCSVTQSASPPAAFLGTHHQQMLPTFPYQLHLCIMPVLMVVTDLLPAGGWYQKLYLSGKIHKCIKLFHLDFLRISKLKQCESTLLSKCFPGCPYDSSKKVGMSMEH
jgi:hypothetical protein